MKYFSIATACLAAAFAVAAPGRAAETSATLSAMQGDVRVNQGQEFAAAQVGVVLAAGDRLMVAQDASAELTFNDGCLYTAAPGMMITVPAISTCAGGAALAQSIQPAHTGALGGSAAAASALEAAAAIGGSVAPPLALGAVALATATHVVVTNATSDDKPVRPLSP